MTKTCKDPTIGRLRELVASSGLTQAEVANRAMLSKQSSVSRLLKGDQNPSMKSVRRILIAIGRTWSDLDPIDGR